MLPTASFTAIETFGDQPFSAHFIDTSEGSPTTWNWDFGDGTSSAEQNPTHVYENSGVYSPSLYVTNSEGDSYKILVGMIGVSSTCEPTTNPYISHVVNGSFSDWANGLPVGWGQVTGSKGVSKSTDCIIGSNSLLITGDSSTECLGKLWQLVNDGENYTRCGCWIKITGITQGELNISLWDGSDVYAKQFRRNCDWTWFEWRFVHKNEYQYAELDIYTSGYVNTGAKIYVNGLVFSKDYELTYSEQDTGILSKSVTYMPDQAYVNSTIILRYDNFHVGYYKTETSSATVDNVNYPVTFIPKGTGGQIWVDVPGLSVSDHVIGITTTYSKTGRLPVNNVLEWKGYKLWVREGQGLPMFNRWLPTGAYIDYQDRLHLTVQNINDVWYCSEIDGDRPYSYGKFVWTIEPDSFFMDPNVVLGLYIGGGDKYNEHDIEITKWWDESSKNTWFAIHPKNVWSGDVYPTKNVVCTIEWMPDYCRYTIETVDGVVLVDTTTTDFDQSSVSEALSMNVWLYERPQNLCELDLIISDYKAYQYNPFTDPISVDILQPEKDIEIFQTDRTVSLF